MKTLIVLFVSLSFVMMIACTKQSETKVKKPRVLTSEVYAIHELELKADVDAKEFESFVIKELAPIYNKMIGQNFFLVKGDRGIRTDKYAIVLTFESITDRDRIYPPSGEFVGDFGDDSVWEKLGTFVTEGLGKNHTDYVVINQSW